MQPLISIIIPTYNRTHIIGETLDSIIAQTYTNWECIVVDDGSTDNTPEILQKYIDKDSRFQFCHRPKEKQKGPNSCRNYGFTKSKGDLINFFDSDDLYKVNAFEKVVAMFDENFDSVVVKTEVVEFNSKKYLSENKIKSENLLEDYFIGRLTFYVGGPFWNRKFLQQQEYLFDENIRNIDDWDFNMRMLYQQPRISLVEDNLIQYRMHKDSFSKELGKLNKDEVLSDFKAREKHLILNKKSLLINPSFIKIFIIKRHNKYMKTALFQNNPLKYYLLKKLLQKELIYGYYKQCIKTFVGFVLYLFFRKGYNLLNI